MKRLHSDVGSTDTALKQRPKVLQAISVYAAFYISQSMVNNLVLEFALQALVCAKSVGKQCGSRFDVSSYGTVQGFLFAIRDNLGANLPAALQDSHDHDLVIAVAALS